ncbi:hypothetical protein KGP26_12040 [Serratia sp. JSRIV002]|uniref:hypothetical protein n=1 Tax=Serratia sp. JSRIV002 TaxID=2831894 RepID=UPI001CBEF342|nr:hypothetical protein [Serratia sp. JSRIV002]UAN53732.1 hypothetical protein KGP26_12040 [Serratia sp. JSRIV002]HEJ9057256.1 hypothetical protein [Serratia fonticola]
MIAPFFAAANRVLRMYDIRQTSSTRVPADTSAEVFWAAERLLDLAGAAAYSASTEAVAIREAAEYWKRYGKHPAFFPEELIEEAIKW